RALVSLKDTDPAESSPLSLHDALPIYASGHQVQSARETEHRGGLGLACRGPAHLEAAELLLRLTRQSHASPPPQERPLPTSCAGDRKSTRLNSSHVKISYAVFCLKKKK